MLIHQQLHGYKRGHQLLAGSLQLSQTDQELVERLSDLSGSLRANTKIYPYITAYPLQESSYYALARTWSDDCASRSGCVITHTLLIPLSEWIQSKRPSIFCNLFHKLDSLKTVDVFKKALSFNCDAKSTDILSPFDPIYNKQLEEFAYKFFGEGVKPIVWYGLNCPELIFWGLINFLWPNARRNFSCCTLALQPRMIKNKFFDLMFSPKAYYPRFNKISVENSIGYFNSECLSKIYDKKFPWTTDTAQKIVKGIGISSEVLALLDDDPVSIRKAYLILDLEKRIKKSPTATIGILDILDTIDQNTNRLIDLRLRYINKALMSTPMIATTNEALRFYYLLCERMEDVLLNDKYIKIIYKIKKNIAGLASKELSMAMESCLNLEKLEKSQSLQIFFEGLLEGVIEASKSNPNNLLTLEKYPDFSTRIICADATIAVIYLKYIQKINDVDDQREHLSEWLSNVKNEKNMEKLRNCLLPAIRYDYENHILEELVRGVASDKDLTNILETLFLGTNGLVHEKLLAVLIEAFCTTFRVELQNWASKTSLWSEGVAKLIAHSFSIDSAGLHDLISFNFNNKDRHAEIIAKFVGIATFRQFPFWLRKFAQKNPEFVVIMLEANVHLSFVLSNVIYSILAEVRNMPLARYMVLQNLLEKYKNTELYESLLNMILQSCANEFINNNISLGEFKSWMRCYDSAMVDIQKLYDNIESIVMQNKLHGLQNFINCWIWIENAPDSFYNNSNKIVKIIYTLSMNRNFYWNKKIVDCWINVISRAKTCSEPSIYYNICGIALDVAFKGKDKALSELLVASFYPVYEVVLNCKYYPSSIEAIFGFFDWDKAKELRKRLIDKYYYSKWPVGHLVFAARDKVLIRKIFKRVYRTKGEGFIKEILHSLELDINSSNHELILYFRSLVNDPEYYEPWD